jgi:hypothetical protein
LQERVQPWWPRRGSCGSAGKNQPLDDLRRQGGGYAIAIPKTWQLILRTQAGVKR